MLSEIITGITIVGVFIGLGINKIIKTKQNTYDSYNCNIEMTEYQYVDLWLDDY